MKFGINALLWTASFTPEFFPLLPRLKSAGFDAVEVPLFYPDEFSAAQLRRVAADHGLEVTVVAVLPSGSSMLADNPAERHAAQSLLERYIHLTAEAGSRLIGGPLYSPVGFLPGRRRTPAEWDRVVGIYGSVTRTLEATGVTVAIEPINRFETFFLNTTADAVQLCDQIAHPNVGILFDTFHANIEEKDVAASLRLAAPHLKHVHTCENDRGTPGTGHVDWPGVFTALHDIGYNGHLTIESFAHTIPAIAAAAAIWRDLAPVPDDIAFEGVRFLRANARPPSS